MFNKVTLRLNQKSLRSDFTKFKKRLFAKMSIGILLFQMLVIGRTHFSDQDDKQFKVLSSAMVLVCFSLLVVIIWKFPAQNWLILLLSIFITAI